MKSAVLADYFPLPEGDLQLNEDYIEFNQAIALSHEQDKVLVGVCSTDGESLGDELKTYFKKDIDFLKINISELMRYIGKQDGLSENESNNGQVLMTRNQLDKIANDAPTINLVNRIIMDAISAEASDIHIECLENRSRVRYRIDGVLQQTLDFDRSRFAGVSSRIKIMSGLNIMERRMPQDGRISVTLEGSPLDIRTSIIPASDGESIALRLFHKQNKGIKLNDLGFSTEQEKQIFKLCSSPHGLYLVTGPTGSGKTTTINAILREINSIERKIITIEDPVEYKLDGIEQIQTNEKIGLTFGSLLRRVLRQDPDVIMVGEIRDTETAQLALRAALTGHFVLSTLHTNDAPSAVTRLRNMGLESYLISGVLKGVIAQRLVRKLCGSCKIKSAPSSELQFLAEKYKLNIKNEYKPVGCPKCHNTGYYGRIALSEHLQINNKVEKLILEEETAVKIRKAGDLDTDDLLGDGLVKIASGITSMEEVGKAAFLS